MDEMLKTYLDGLIAAEKKLAEIQQALLLARNVIYPVDGDADSERMAGATNAIVEARDAISLLIEEEREKQIEANLPTGSDYTREYSLDDVPF